MKKVLLVAVLAFAVAQPVQATTREEAQKICGAVSEIAEVIMDARQKGVPIQRMIDLMADAGEYQDLAYELILEAYDYPHIGTDRLVNDVIREFKTKTYLSCVRVWRK